MTSPTPDVLKITPGRPATGQDAGDADLLDHPVRVTHHGGGGGASQQYRDDEGDHRRQADADLTAERCELSDHHRQQGQQHAGQEDPVADAVGVALGLLLARLLQLADLHLLEQGNDSHGEDQHPVDYVGDIAAEGEQHPEDGPEQSGADSAGWLVSRRTRQALLNRMTPIST